MQYIPVKETLKALLKDPAVRQECSKSHSNTASTVLSDVSDGTVFKSNSLFMEPGLTLKLILYQDAFEVVNPLGSARRKHKILGVYFTLANFEPLNHSCVDNLQLVLLCSEKEFRYFAHDKLFAKMLSDLQDLERHGIVTESGQVVRATVLCIVGDNLGSHSIGGFVENLSNSDYCCRFCCIPTMKKIGRAHV